MSRLPENIYFCYAAEDTDWANRLYQALEPMVVEGALQGWFHAVTPESTKDDLVEFVQTYDPCGIAVVLVSPNLEACKLVWSHLLPELHRAAEEEEVSFLWVPIRRCNLADELALRHRCLGNPAEPLADLRSRVSDLAFEDIAQALKRQVQSLQTMIEENQTGSRRLPWSRSAASWNSGTATQSDESPDDYQFALTPVSGVSAAFFTGCAAVISYYLFEHFILGKHLPAGGFEYAAALTAVVTAILALPLTAVGTAPFSQDGPFVQVIVWVMLAALAMVSGWLLLVLPTMLLISWSVEPSTWKFWIFEAAMAVGLLILLLIACVAIGKVWSLVRR